MRRDKKEEGKRGIEERLGDLGLMISHQTERGIRGEERERERDVRGRDERGIEMEREKLGERERERERREMTWEES